MRADAPVSIEVRAESLTLAQTVMLTSHFRKEYEFC
jgi:hypothetical protein